MKGSVIGQYRVTGVLGQGGMGMVFAAEHTLLGRPAAVKVLLPELSSKQEVVQRFFNEARAATAIRHPGIVEIYDFGWTDDGSAFIVMEYLQGESLRARRTRGRIPWASALSLTRQIAGALGAAHAKGIVHRDLKPDNVYVVPDPEVPGGERIKLLDFGIAKLASSSSGQHKTRTGAVIGTPAYMAPEQCRGVAVDSRADLYSLGCILFELCTGRPPFLGEGEGDVLAAHIHTPSPKIASHAKGVPKDIEALAQRMLAKAPADRVQTAEEVIRLIDAANTATARASTAAPTHTTADAAAARGTIYSDTTLSSAASTNNLGVARAPRNRLLIAGVAGGAVAAAALIAIAIGAGGGKPSGGTQVSQESVAGAAVDAEALPSPPPAPAKVDPPPPKEEPAAPKQEPAAPREEPAASKQEPAAPPPKEEPAPKEGPAPPKEEPRLASTPPKRRELVPPPPPPTIDIAITSKPSNAEVLRDGRIIGKTPFHISMLRKDRDVKFVLRLSGYNDKTITVNTGAPSKQAVQLAPVAHNKVVNPFD